MSAIPVPPPPSKQRRLWPIFVAGVGTTLVLGVLAGAVLDEPAPANPGSSTIPATAYSDEAACRLMDRSFVLAGAPGASNADVSRAATLLRRAFFKAEPGSEVEDVIFRIRGAVTGGASNAKFEQLALEASRLCLQEGVRLG